MCVPVGDYTNLDIKPKSGRFFVYISCHLKLQLDSTGFGME